MPDSTTITSLQKIFPRAYPKPVSSGLIKQSPEDFIVEEALSFPFSGEGEHAYLKIRKTDQNTMWVVGVLAKHFGVKERDIGYAGLKDRRAVTSQWFSLLAKSATPEKIAAFTQPGIEIVDIQRHSGKLRKGAIKHNAFKLTVREFDADESKLHARVSDIISMGVPNYFDEQRFGRQRQNLAAATKLFNGELRGKLSPKKSKRRIYLSAARSWLFNLVVAERVHQNCWASGLNGDVFMLEGSKKFFHEENLSDDLVSRLKKNDIHPTAPLWGEGEIQTSSTAKELELGVLEDWKLWCQQLVDSRMKQQRRATRMLPQGFEYDYNKTKARLEVSFNLPAGCYATNLLREIVAFD